MSELVLCCGKVCSGKSRFALHLKENYRFIHFSADKWMLNLYGFIENRDEFDSKLQKCKILINEVVKQILDCGIDVVLDYGFWTEDERNQYRNNELFKKHKVSIVYLEVNEDDQERYNGLRYKSKDNDSYMFTKPEITKINELFEEPKDNFESIGEYCRRKSIKYVT